MVRLLSCAALFFASLPALGAPVEPAKVGVRLLALPDQVLIAEVIPGMGADQAGLQIGDTLLRVDGVAVGGDEEQARARLKGPPGTAVAVTLRAPLGGPERTVSVSRGLPASPPRPADLPAVVREFRHQLLKGSRKQAEAAAQALLAQDFGGLPPAEAVGNTLRAADARDPRAAAAVADALRPRARQDPALAALLARLDLQHQEFDQALRTYAPLIERRPPDLEAGSLQVDLGGAFDDRRLYAETAWDQGRKEAAAAEARRLLPFDADQRLTPRIPIARPPAAAPWRAPLPPAPPVVVNLLDGSPWRLADQAGEVSVLTFWATWCGPCRMELPELQTLHQRLPDVRFLAISTDDASTAAEIGPTAARLGLTFPVAHGPAWGAAFGVSSIPAVRVIGRDGAVVYTAKGYSPQAIERLTAAIEEARAAAPAAGASYATPAGPATARLRAFLPLTNAQGLYADAAHIIVGMTGQSPLILDAAGAVLADPDVSQGRNAPKTRLTWLDGPVAIDPGAPFVRAFGPDGEDRWLLPLDADPVDLIAADGLLWVATTKDLLRLSADGRLIDRLPLRPSDLAADPAGGAWALADGRLHHLRGKAPAPEDRGPAPGVTQLGPQGERGRAVVQQIIAGRYGPDGARRLVALREGNLVVGLAADGAPAFTLKLNAPAQLAAHDLDQDGQDELLIVTRGQGLATVDLRLP